MTPDEDGKIMFWFDHEVCGRAIGIPMQEFTDVLAAHAKDYELVSSLVNDQGNCVAGIIRELHYVEYVGGYKALYLQIMALCEGHGLYFITRKCEGSTPEKSPRYFHYFHDPYCEDMKRLSDISKLTEAEIIEQLVDAYVNDPNAPDWRYSDDIEKKAGPPHPCHRPVKPSLLDGVKRHLARLALYARRPRH